MCETTNRIHEGTRTAPEATARRTDSTLQERGDSSARRNRSMRSTGTVLALVLLCAAAVPRARGEEAVLRLTLQESVRMALRQNPQVQIAGIGLAESEQDKAIARSALLPQIRAEVSETYRRSNFEAFTGRPISGFPKQVGPFSVFQGGGSFSAPIFDLTLWRRWQAAGDAAGGMGAEARSVEEQTVLLVVSQYLGCLRENADIEAIRSRVDLAQALRGLAEDLQSNGVGTRIDTLRADVTLQNEKQRLIAAETRSKTCLYGLARLLNADPQARIELADSMAFLESRDAEEAGDLESAYATRPEMRALDARLKAADRRMQAAKASRLPSLYADGFWAYQGLSVGNSIPVYEYRARLSFPLFTGGRLRAEAARADLEKSRLMQERTELRNRIALEVKVARAAIESARSELVVADLGLKLAGEEIVQARDRFEAGVTNNIEVITAQDELARASDNRINALYRYNQARADLAHARGQMELIFNR
jgi:outer membrane protein